MLKTRIYDSCFISIYSHNMYILRNFKKVLGLKCHRMWLDVHLLLCLYIATGSGSRLGVDRGSPAVHNGPVGGASPRSGQRRQQAESPDPSAERGRLLFHYLNVQVHVHVVLSLHLSIRVHSLVCVCMQIV